MALGIVPPILPPILPPVLEPEPPRERGEFRYGTTGNRSERVHTVAITRRAGVAERVVISLGPRKLPRLRAGDRLAVRAEVQASTTCVHPGPHCIGRHYDFNPRVRARLVLADGETAVRGRPLSGWRSVRCNQRRPDRNHHCVLTFRAASTVIRDPDGLPCEPETCRVNLVLGASNRHARSGHRMAIGGDRPDGRVVQDKGRISVVVTRRGGGSPARLVSTEIATTAIEPRADGEPPSYAVVYSVELPGLRRGEVIAADGAFAAAIDHLPYNAYVSSRLILATSPTATGPSGLAAEISRGRGQLTEANGFNCTRGRSGFASPCKVVKAGATKITADAVDALDADVPIYLNLVARAKALLARPRIADRATVAAADGGLRVLRYTPR
jgi:hypothetical protein